METTIKIHDGSRKTLKFIDAEYNQPGWLKLEIDGEEVGDILLEEIMPALIGFDAKFSRAKETP